MNKTLHRSQAWVAGMGLALLTSCALAAPPLAARWEAAQMASIQSLGPWPPPVTLERALERRRVNPLSGLPQAVALGQKLFAEPALSGNGQISCATCHRLSRSFTDGLRTAKGMLRGHRNTPPLLDLADQRWFGWDGGSDSLWAATLRPLLDPAEMAGSAALTSKTLTRRPDLHNLAQPLHAHLAQLGGAWQSGPRDEQMLVLAAMSMAAWMEGLVSAPTPFDRYRDALQLAAPSQRRAALARSGFTATAERGLAIFTGKGHCLACHGGPRFTHGEFHDIGIAFLVHETGTATEPGNTPSVDPGRFRGIERVRLDPYNLIGPWSPDRYVERANLLRQTVLQHRNWGEWKIPSLRNLRQTAPYMHNGSLASLGEVVEHYSRLNEERLHADGEALLKPLRLTPQEARDLVAFLESLSPP